jgi:hypothetical protein
MLVVVVLKVLAMRKKLGRQIATHCPSTKAYTRQQQKKINYKSHERKNSYLCS